jgi:diaminohydroxyphosphoribosylaminopyrimidine deaminase/5-amino-6-(5-phosphoribosylamino)uracil reductase
MNYRVLRDEHRIRTIVATSRERADSPAADALRREGITVVGVSVTSAGRLALDELFATIGKELSITSVLVEGGAQVLSWCIERGLLDELHLFVAPMMLGHGVSFTAALSAQSLQSAQRWHYHALGRAGDDTHLILLPQRPS